MKRMMFFARRISSMTGLDALFELAAIFGAGDHESEVEGDDALVAQQFGHVALRDFLGETFHDGSLAHAGFTEQNRIVSWCGGRESG
jgi:hypothetical protein